MSGVATAPRLGAALLTPQRDEDGAPSTLDQAMGASWQALQAGQAASCVVCGGEMEPAPDGGRCRDCGSCLF